MKNSNEIASKIVDDNIGYAGSAHLIFDIAAAIQEERDRADKAIELLKETYSPAVSRCQPIEVHHEDEEDLEGRVLKFLLGDDLSTTEKSKDEAITRLLVLKENRR